MPKKDNKTNPKASAPEDEDPKVPTKSTGAIPKSHSYAGHQETETRGRKRATAATAAKSEDESEYAAAGLWAGRTRSSAKPQPEEGTSKGVFARFRSKSKSKSPTKREKSKSKSPTKKGKRTKSPSPHRSLFGSRKKSISPTKRVEEEQEEEESSDEEEGRRGITPVQELRTIMESSKKRAVRSLTVRPGPDTVPLIQTPPDSSPLLSKTELYKANLGKLPDPQTCIELKEDKASPVEDDLTNTSSVSMSSLVKDVQLDDDSGSLKSEASSGKSKRKK